MLGYDGPIESPSLSPFLDRAVAEFGGESEERQYVVRYHNEPVWFAREEPEQGFFQQVQIAVFQRQKDEEPMIFFISFAYTATCDSETRVIPPDLMCRRPVQLSKVMSVPVPDRVDFLKKELSLAWEKARQFKRSQVFGKS